MRVIYLIILVGIFLLTRLFFFYSERHIYKEGENFKETYSFNHEPKKNSMGQYFFVGNTLVTVPLFPKYHYGDKVTITGKVDRQDSMKRSLLIVKDPTIKVVEEKSILLGVSKFVRYRIVESAITTLPAREAGLLLGIVLGVRDKIDQDFYQQLRNAGVLHVIAASGQNISIAGSLLLAIFSKIVKRKTALLFTGGGIVFYAFLTGFDPSIVRAAIMALITFGALVLGKQSRGLYALFATGIIMVLQKPEMIEDISFQLSFLSTLGILTIKPILDRVVIYKFFSILKDDSPQYHDIYRKSENRIDTK